MRREFKNNTGEYRGFRKSYVKLRAIVRIENHWTTENNAGDLTDFKEDICGKNCKSEFFKHEFSAFCKRTKFTNFHPNIQIFAPHSSSLRSRSIHPALRATQARSKRLLRPNLREFAR